ncbi:hypothetical protein BU032_02785 [Staphylococcus simulans]|nr:hypothetical protein BU032_02785 [Staphylococcus simulans]
MSVFEAISIMIAFCDLQFTILVFIFCTFLIEKNKPSTNFDKSDGLFFNLQCVTVFETVSKSRVRALLFFNTFILSHNINEKYN